MKNYASSIAIGLGFAVLLAAPFIFRQRVADQPGDAPQLIILTPHNEQIRYEFKRAFERWHRERFDAPVTVIWSVVGGTSDIRQLLEAQFEAALRDGAPPGGAADLVFGGGQYEHDRLKQGVRLEVEGEVRETSISAPVWFDRGWLLETYGVESVAGSPLFDPDGYWFGTALSSFGIIFNNDVLRTIEVSAPTQWDDLCHARLRGRVALGNPDQSGSIRKSFDTILQHRGWTAGWRILRRAAANARYFSASASKVPIDVSQGDAAAGLCIDFYGRYQSQAIADAGDPDRVGYIDPPGESAVDADPVSMLRGAPRPDLARRFIEFTLTEEAQALWQFPAVGEVPRAAARPLGPQRFELRRMPILKSMYEEHFDRFIDRANPFEFSRPFERFNPHFWSFASVIFSAMAIDNEVELREAWHAITNHPAFPNGDELVTAAGVTDPTLKEMLDLFDAMPTVAGPDGARYDLAGEDDLPVIRAGWLDGGWAGAGLWPGEASPEQMLRQQFGAFFQRNYDEIARLAAQSTAK